MNERAREVQTAVGYVRRLYEEAVEWRDKEVQEREEKVVELKQAPDEREHVLDQRGSELEERGLKNSKKKWKRVLLNLVVSTRPLRHLARYSSSVYRLSCVG